MTRIAQKFGELEKLGQKCLTCYLTGGDPDLNFSKEAIFAIAEAGADLIEVGVPFSDPLADGPTIQAASTRALLNGTTVRGILEMVKEVRQNSEIPLIALMDYNLVYQYRIENFARDAAESGFDGAIIPNLPVPEAQPWIKAAKKYNLDTVFLAAPTSNEESLREIVEASTGFVYILSLLGVTGARESLAEGLRELVTRVKAHAKRPVLVGFGISKPEHVREVCQIADGAIVGSALVELLAEEHQDEKTTLAKAMDFVSKMKKATFPKRGTSLCV